MYILSCTDYQATPELAKQKCLEVMIKLAVAYGSGELTRLQLKPKKAELLQMRTSATPKAVRKRPAAAPEAIRRRPAAAETPRCDRELKKPKVSQLGGESDKEDTLKSEQEQEQQQSQPSQQPEHDQAEKSEELEIDQESEDRPAHKACRSRWVVASAQHRVSLVLVVVMRCHRRYCVT